MQTLTWDANASFTVSNGDTFTHGNDSYVIGRIGRSPKWFSWKNVTRLGCRNPVFRAKPSEKRSIPPQVVFNPLNEDQKTLDTIAFLEKNLTYSSIENIVNEYVRAYLKIVGKRKYNNGAKLKDFYPSGGSGAVGAFKSQLSNIISPNIGEYLGSISSDFQYVDTDGIDFKYTAGADGDMKINFSDNGGWTGNGCSKKMGVMILIKIILNEEAIASSDNLVEGLYVGCIDANYINNNRGKGNSDLSNIVIPNENSSHLKSLIGSAVCKTKRVGYNIKYANKEETCK